MLFTLIKRNAAHKEYTHQVITGVFNAKEICWEYMEHIVFILDWTGVAGMPRRCKNATES